MQKKIHNQIISKKGKNFYKKIEKKDNKNVQINFEKKSKMFWKKIS